MSFDPAVDPRWVAIHRSYGSMVVDRLMLFRTVRIYYGSMARWKAQIHVEALNAGEPVPSHPTLLRLAVQRRWAA